MRMTRGKLIFVLVIVGLLLAVVWGHRQRGGSSNPSATVAPSTAAKVQSEPTQQPSAQKRGDPWPIFRGDASLRGVVGASEPRVTTPMKLGWTFTTGKAVKSSPVVAQGLLFIGSNDGKVYALDAKSGKKKWAFVTEMEVEAPPMWFDGVVYVGSADGRMYALQADTGRELWRFAAEDKILGSANVWTSSDGQRRSLVFGSYDSKVYALDLATGQLQWSFQTENYINGAPAVAGDRLVLGGCDGKLHVISAISGIPLFTVDLGGPIAGSPAVDGEVAYIGGYNNRFVAVRLDAVASQVKEPISIFEFRISNIENEITETAQQPGAPQKTEGGDGRANASHAQTPNDEAMDHPAIMWSYRDRSFPYFSSPAVTDELVIFGGRDRRLHALDKATGQRRWMFAARNKIDSSPVVVGDKVVVGSDDGRLYVVNLADGKLVWSYTIGAAIVGSSAVALGWVYVGADDGKVYGFQSEK